MITIIQIIIAMFITMLITYGIIYEIEDPRSRFNRKRCKYYKKGKCTRIDAFDIDCVITNKSK